MESENFVANAGSRGVMKELKKSPVKWTSVSASIIFTFMSVVFLVVIFPSSIHGIFAAGQIHSFVEEFIFLPTVSCCSKTGVSEINAVMSRKSLPGVDLRRCRV